MHGWSITGGNVEEYELVGAPDAARNGKLAARLRCTANHAKSFGATAQPFSAADYAGKRVRLRGDLRAERVGGWTGLWMRVDGPPAQGSKVLAFDNMQDRALTGTTDWTPCEVVLDVPEEAQTVVIGTVLFGDGSVLMSDFHVDAVSPDVPTTSVVLRRHP